MAYAASAFNPSNNKQQVPPPGTSMMMMNQLPVIPQPQHPFVPQALHDKPVISCTGYSTKLVDRQWTEFGPPGRCIIEVVLPNIINLKKHNVNEIFHQIQLLPGAKITKRDDNYSFYLLSDPSKQSFYGLRLTEHSPANTFHQEVQNLINNLELLPDECSYAYAKNENHAGIRHNSASGVQEQRPQVLQQNFVQTGPQNEAVPTSNQIPENLKKETKIDSSCEELAKAIEKGKVEEAMNHVRILCELEPRLTIHTIPKETNFVIEKELSIIVRITDRDDTQEKSYTLQIGDPSATTIGMLKKEMWQKFQFSIQSQRWVLNRYLAEDNRTLSQCGIKHNSQIAYLYLVSHDLQKENIAQEPLYESIDNYQNNGIQPQPNVQFPHNYNGNQAQFNAQYPPKLMHPPQQDQQNYRQYGAQSMWIANSHMPQQNHQAVNYLQRNFQNQQGCYQVEPDGAGRPRFVQTAMGNPTAFAPNAQQRTAARHPAVRKRTEHIGWNCPTCTFKNSPTFPGCKMCTAPRPDDYEIPKGYELTKEEKDRLDSEKLNEKMALEAEFKRKENEAKMAQENYRTVMNLAQKRILPNHEEFDCPICYTTIDKGEGAMLRECLHCFCKDCLTLHINTSEDPEVHCPENAGFPCPAVITGQEIEELLSPEEFAKFLDRSLAQAEYNTENSFHCRSTNCKGWCVYEDDVNEFQCEICTKINCLTCKAQHPDQTCKAYQEDLKLRAENDDAAKKTQQMLDELVNRGDAMHCPQCKVILQKKSGCDWMRCTMCKTEICWATKGARWGPAGKGDTSGGCKCGLNGQRCTPTCGNCH